MAEVPRLIQIEFDGSNLSDETRLEFEPRSEGDDEVWLDGQRLEAQVEAPRAAAATDAPNSAERSPASIDANEHADGPADQEQEKGEAFDYVRSF